MKIQALLFSFMLILFVCGASLVLALPALSDPQLLLQASSLAEKTPATLGDNVEDGVVPQAISCVMTADDQMQSLRDENDRLHETVRMFSDQIQHLKKIISRDQNQSEGYGNDYDMPRPLDDDDRNHRSDEQWKSGHWGLPGKRYRPQVWRKSMKLHNNFSQDDRFVGCHNCDPRELTKMEDSQKKPLPIKFWALPAHSEINNDERGSEAISGITDSQNLVTKKYDSPDFLKKNLSESAVEFILQKEGSVTQLNSVVSK